MRGEQGGGDGLDDKVKLEDEPRLLTRSAWLGPANRRADGFVITLDMRLDPVFATVVFLVLVVVLSNIVAWYTG